MGHLMVFFAWWQSRRCVYLYCMNVAFFSVLALHHSTGTTLKRQKHVSSWNVTNRVPAKSNRELCVALQYVTTDLQPWEISTNTQTRELTKSWDTSIVYVSGSYYFSMSRRSMIRYQYVPWKWQGASVYFFAKTKRWKQQIFYIYYINIARIANAVQVTIWL